MGKGKEKPPEPAGSPRNEPAPAKGANSAFSGSKPGRNGGQRWRLTDDEAFAELRRRQLERARRRR